MGKRNVKLLDCTLRDGGRVIDCEFPDQVTSGIAKGLATAGIDIIEVGFLRDKIEYGGNSTFFTHVDQIRPFINRSNKETLYVVFVDEGMFDIGSIPQYDKTSIDGIRYGFTKKTMNSAPEEIEKLQKKGYKIFVQAVDTLSYSDVEILHMVEEINRLKPYSFGIVDTYGAMYEEDLVHYFGLLDRNLSPDIAIDFHSHNNYQLSFSLAQIAVKLSATGRNIIIDSTLTGMGKRAGNLNTELIANYLNQKHHYNYGFDAILDLCDEYIEPLKKIESWGYSTPAFLAGVFRVHPNNIVYLTEKLRMGAKSIKSILDIMDDEKRRTYDYDNIERLYFEYNNNKTEEAPALESLRNAIQEKPVLILAPGGSLESHSKDIEKFISERNPTIISVNFIDDVHSESLAFIGRQSAYNILSVERAGRQVLLTSNVKSDTASDWVFDYYGATKRGCSHFDNSVIMLLRILLKLNFQDIAFAGFDGFSHNVENNYSARYKQPFNDLRSRDTFDETNSDLQSILLDYALYLKNKNSVTFITPSLFAKCFLDN